MSTIHIIAFTNTNPNLLDQLYTTRSVTRSAEVLGQSQPTLSIWLAPLLAYMRAVAPGVSL